MIMMTDTYNDIDNMNINQNQGVEKPQKKGKKNNQRRIKSFGLYGYKGSNSYDGFEKLFSSFSIEILHPIEQTNLQNYYKKDSKTNIIHCLLCNLDIEQADNNVFSHTISPAHKTNKLFYNFVQNHRKQGNIDYIIFDQWALCRYCDDVIFPNFLTELLSDHITNSIHLYKKRYCLYRVSQYSSNLKSKQLANLQYQNMEKQKIVITAPDTIHLDEKRYCSNRISQYSSNLESKHLANVQRQNMEKQKIVTTASDAVELDNINRLFSHYSIAKLNSIDKMDLRYFNAIKFGNGSIHCSICEVDIKSTLATPHTLSLTHQRNKIFYNFVQKRHRFGDIDYIVLNKNWVVCRYCDDVTVASFSTKLRISHVQEEKHLIRKQYCLNRIANVQKFSPETESFPSYPTMLSTNHVQKYEYLNREQYYFNRVANVQQRDTRTDKLNLFLLIFVILCIYYIFT